MKNADSIHDGCVPDMEWGGADTLDSRQAVPEFEIEQPITKRFEQQVVLNRGRLAVKTQTYELTYNELNRWANRIARSIAHTTGPDAGIVAILLDHDAPLIAAILAVLKSGNCYVAMDPSHPVDRLHNIIDDSQASLLITDNVNFSLAENIVGDQHSLLNLDRLPLDTSDENLELEIPPSALAHMVYTSGSTGIPKGVCQTHRNVMHNVRNFTNACQVNATDRLSLLSLCCYAPSVTDTFAALLNGGALLPFKVAEMGPAKLCEWLRREEITVYHSVPLVFRNMLGTVTDQNGFPHLRLIKLGGEVVLRSDVDLFKQHFSDSCRLYVGLGTSETNIIRYILLDKQTEIEGYTVPAGYAVGGKEVLLLDDNLQEVPIGETGEIAVRSSYLFTGYWRKPELTEASYSQDPRCNGERVFRTGDIGRMLPNGLLLHLGRKDAQIKIRGVRIDPSEVESAFKGLPEVRDCVVTATQNDVGDKRLVAYLVAKAKDLPDNATLRMRVVNKLPVELIPSVFIWLERIPLTPNGKVDRKLLPMPDDIRVGLRQAYVAPVSGLEKKLANIWASALNLNQVGIDDNFFELGGDSLLAVSITEEIKIQFGVDLPLSTFVEAGTVRQFAEAVANQDTKKPWSSIVVLQPYGTKTPLFCIHPGGGNVLGYTEFVSFMSKDQPVYGVQAYGVIEGQEPHDDLKAMAAAYIEAIREIQPKGPYFLGGESFGGLAAYEIAQQLSAAGEKVAFLFIGDNWIRNGIKTRSLKYFLSCLFFLLKMGPREWWAHIGKKLGLIKVEKKEHVNRYTFANELHRRNSLAHIRATRNYLPAAYPGKITLFRASKMPLSVRMQEYYLGSNMMGWEKYVKGGIEVYMMPDVHREMMHGENAEGFAKQLEECLSRAQATA